VATSRRRERELARRRFERRRQAELERRAKTKRRNNVIGAVVGTIVLIAALVGGGFAIFGGSGHHKAKTNALSSPASATPTPTPVASSAAPAAPAPTKCATFTPDPPAKGQATVPQVKGKLTNKLVIHDVKAGHGPAAKDGDSLSVYYIGYSCTTGKVFDASYLHKPLATFAVSPLGKASVIEGWNKGLVGMKAGGVRELVIPAAEAYQDAGSQAPTGPNDTLVFLVTATTVKSG
jgi:peptidylprolyl isomerase